MTDPIVGLCTLARGNGGTPEAFTTIASVGDIAGPSLKNQMEDATTHDSAGNEESFPTVRSYGQIKFPINFLPTNATHNYTAGIVHDWSAKHKWNYKLTFSDSTYWIFPCYVEQIDFKEPVKGLLSADVTLRVTGAATLA